MIIFLTSGLWHGANWTYVAWGAYHALLFVPLILTGGNKKFKGVVAEDKLFPTVKEVCQIGMTFTLVLFGWIIFRASTIHQAYDYVCGLFDPSILSRPYDSPRLLQLVILCTLLMFIEWIQRKKEHSLDLGLNSHETKFAIYIALLMLIFLYGGHAETFIYFQF